MHSSPPQSNGSSSESSKHFYQLTWVRYASLLMILFIFVGFWLYSESLISSIESLRSELNVARSVLTREEELLKILGSPGLSAFPLRGENPDQHGTVFFDSSTRTAVLKTANLPPAGEGASYQIWALVQRRSFPLGSCAENSAIADSFWITVALDSSIQTPDGFLVSLESSLHPAFPSQEILFRTNPAIH